MRLFGGTAVLLALGVFNGHAGAAPKALSCEMQAMLNGVTALQRDQGVPRAAAAINKNPGGELTRREIAEILERVYAQEKNRSPDEIKDAVFLACRGPEDPRTVKLTCYDVGYKYGSGASAAMQGKKVDQADDIILPKRCKDDPDAQRGIADSLRSRVRPR